MKEQFTVDAVCLFCGTTLHAEENAKFESGDMITCDSCGEMNDYDSVLEVAAEKGAAMVAEDVMSEISKTFKKTFK